MTRIRKDPSEWQLTLARDLKAWCEKKKVKKAQLAGMLGVHVGIADNMVRGRTIVESVPDAYARLFEVTGLPSADPRGPIPSRINTFSKGGIQERRWTDQMWKDWHSSAIYYQWKAGMGNPSDRQKNVTGQRKNLSDGLDILVDLTGERIRELYALLKKGTPDSRQLIAELFGEEIEDLGSLLDAWCDPSAREAILMLTEATRGKTS